ncbi:hypothetical protein [Streptomyces sp. NPDC050804]|uniref:hypothetical protein n=1 Tax=Streptomyces sp. NPDC050804 TaxID=3154745 RepID=UPI00342BE34C
MWASLLPRQRLIRERHPLYAYLDTQHTVAGSKGRLATVNLVHEHVTESSLKNSLVSARA